MTVSRRKTLGLICAGLPLATGAARLGATEPLAHEPAAPPLPGGAVPKVYDQVGLEWVMDIVPFCTEPEFMGDKSDQVAADGDRYDVWPIIGGTFRGRGIQGIVVPGGGDFPVVRPDGVVIVDALYRLKTDDGYEIIIHNSGHGYSESKYRLLPTFNVTWTEIRMAARIRVRRDIDLPRAARNQDARFWPKSQRSPDPGISSDLKLSQGCG